MKNMKTKTHKAIFAYIFNKYINTHISIRIGFLLFSIAIFYHFVFAISIKGLPKPINVIWFIILIPILFLSCFKQIKFKIFCIEFFLLSVLAIISYLSSQLYVVIIPILTCLIILWIYSLKYLSFSTTKKTLFVISNLLIVCSTYIFQLGYNPIALYGYKVYEPLRLHSAWNSLTVLKNKKYGVVDALTGKEILPIYFDTIDHKHDLFIHVPKEKTYVLDMAGLRECKDNAFITFEDSSLKIERFFNKKLTINDLTKRGGKHLCPKELDDSVRLLFHKLKLRYDYNLINQIAGDTIQLKYGDLFESLEFKLFKTHKLIIDSINTLINDTKDYQQFDTDYLNELKYSIAQSMTFIGLKDGLTIKSNSKRPAIEFFNMYDYIIAYKNCHIGYSFCQFELNHHRFSIHIKYESNGYSSNEIINKTPGMINDFYRTAAIRSMDEYKLIDAYRTSQLFTEKPRTELEKSLFDRTPKLLKGILDSDHLINYHSEVASIWKLLLYCKLTKNMNIQEDIRLLKNYYDKETFEILNIDSEFISTDSLKSHVN